MRREGRAGRKRRRTPKRRTLGGSKGRLDRGASWLRSRIPEMQMLRDLFRTLYSLLRSAAAVEASQGSRRCSSPLFELHSSRGWSISMAGSMPCNWNPSSSRTRPEFRPPDDSSKSNFALAECRSRLALSHLRLLLHPRILASDVTPSNTPFHPPRTPTGSQRPSLHATTSLKR